MAAIPVIVDSHLVLPDFFGEVGPLDAILDELTIPNQAKAVAKRQKRYGWWDLPDAHELWDFEGDNFILPRGYAARLKEICGEYGKKVVWLDRRTGRRGHPFRWRKEFEPRIHQPLAVKKMRKYQQGMYQAPTGSGKSLTCIKFIHDVSPQQTIIYVDKLDLLNQWLKNIEEWLCCVPGQIGNGKWEMGERIVVATVQTVAKRMREGTLPEGFFQSKDCVIVDECHHVTAETIRDIVGSHDAKWREGVSATPDKLDDKFEIAEAVLGPVFHEDSEDELIKLGVLVKPSVKVIETDFKFAYWGDHEAYWDIGAKRWICEKPGCKKTHEKHGHRNNYQQLKDAIVADIPRNILIAETLAGELRRPHHHLIVSDEIRHLDAIEEEIIATLPGLPIYRLTGKITGKRRKEAIAQIEKDEACIILATVAKEGLDIPVIDRVYLPFPSGNHKNTQQKVGRATRSAIGKEGAVIFDFFDKQVGILKKQFRNRAHGLYHKKGMEVIR